MPLNSLGVRFGRAKLAYTFMLFRAVYEPDAVRGTTRGVLSGDGPGLDCRRFTSASVLALETPLDSFCGFDPRE